MSDTYDSLVTSFGSPGAALGELSKAYPPELIKRFQMATGLIAKLSSAPSLTANQQRLLDKANKKGN
jgi:hypothetical protein